MSIYSDAIDRFYELQTASFGYLERFSFQQSIDPIRSSGTHLEIILVDGLYSNTRRLVLSFDGVKSLRIGDLEGFMRYMFDIASLEESQLEGIHFQVSESEHGAFEFVCDTFTADVLSTSPQFSA